MLSITHWLKLHFILAIAGQLAFWLGIVLIYCAVVWAILHFTNIQIGELGSEASLINTIILGLLMGFRNRTAYERWWEGRRLWGQLINDCRNLACKLSAYIPQEVLNQSPMVRLLYAFPLSLKRHLRKDTFQLQQIPGMAEETDSPTHVPVYLARRMYVQAANWHRDGQLNDMMFRNLDIHLNAMLDVCGACERILNTPLPFSYKAMLRTGLFLHLLIAPWYTISTLGLQGVPVLLIACFFLFGIELIDSHIEDPFGHDEDDLDLERYAAAIGDSVKMILPEQRGT